MGEFVHMARSSTLSKLVNSLTTTTALWIDYTPPPSSGNQQHQSVPRIAVSLAYAYPVGLTKKIMRKATPVQLVVNDAEVTGDKLVLQTCSIGDHNLVALVGDNDTCAGESDTLAEPDVTRDGQVVELGNVGDRLESLLKVLTFSDNVLAQDRSTYRDLLELVSELDDGGSAKLSRLVHAQHAVLEVVELRLDQEQIADCQGRPHPGDSRARLDGQESGSWDVDTDGAVKVLDGGTDG